MEDEVLDRIPPGATTLSCFCQSGASLQPGAEVRWLEQKNDAPFPPVPFPSNRLYREAGHACLAELVVRHHERLRDSVIGHLFPEDPVAFSATVARTLNFVIEASGGPALFTRSEGGMRLRERHFGVTIDENVRDRWLLELLRAFDDVSFPDQWRPSYWRWMEALSIRMINRRTRMQPPPRYPYEQAREKLQRVLREGDGNGDGK